MTTENNNNEFDEYIPLEEEFSDEDSNLLLEDIEELDDIFESFKDIDGETDFSDNMDQEFQYNSLVDKIFQLSDDLSEDIVLKNIEAQLEDRPDFRDDKFNYVKLFVDKYSKINSNDFEYNHEYMGTALYRVINTVREGLHNRYLVDIGEDPENTNAVDYLENIGKLYEFLYIRQYQNLLDYFMYKIRMLDPRRLSYYQDKLNSGEDADDVFVTLAKKKFKNTKDIVIIHFLTDIMKDIIDDTNSAFVLFKDISDIDMFEEVNYYISEALINYGNDIVLNDDEGAAKAYMSILERNEVFNSMKNDITLKYLENVELQEDGN